MNGGEGETDWGEGGVRLGKGPFRPRNGPFRLRIGGTASGGRGFPTTERGYCEWGKG